MISLVIVQHSVCYYRHMAILDVVISEVMEDELAKVLVWQMVSNSLCFKMCLIILNCLIL